MTAVGDGMEILPRPFCMIAVAVAGVTEIFFEVDKSDAFTITGRKDSGPVFGTWRRAR